jgi:predicted RNase H-like HicB family nuclease
MKTEGYLVVIERAARNCSAYAPDVPGCIATGATVEQTLVRMRRALRAHLNGLAEDGEPLPKARALSWHLRNSRDFKPEPGDLFTQLPVSLNETEMVAA